MIMETREITEYLSDTISMDVEAYCALMNIGERGLFKAWKTPKGQQQIKDRVYRLYSEDKTPARIKRFDAL